MKPLRVILCPMILALAACTPKGPFVPELTEGAPLPHANLIPHHEALVARINAAPAKALNGPGLVAATGGLQLKLLKAGAHEVILPIPQMIDSQVPICLFVNGSPSDAIVECRIRQRSRENHVFFVKLQGKQNQEIKISWSSMILFTPKSILPNTTSPDSFGTATACVQSDSEKVKKLAEQLWPTSEKVSDYAASIQRFIRESKQVKQPTSLDALGILDSGNNTICTANSNLASALLRAKGIASRSLAVIPPISQRLEMHRVVEYYRDGSWHVFDPSSLHTDVPMKPWHSVIMAKTSREDEEIAMKLRMGAMAGCPYGQELELLTNGLTPWGQDFFWTLAKPIAEFDVPNELTTLATNEWTRFLESGAASTQQIKAASASSAKELLDSLKAK